MKTVSENGLSGMINPQKTLGKKQQGLNLIFLELFSIL